MMKRLNAKIYHEAKRLGVKWILGGECGHMWRVLHQYMDTMNGPARLPRGARSRRSPARCSRTPRSTKMVHICEFTADLIQHNKLKLDKSRNDHCSVTFHDSCNPARAMGLLEEPRYVHPQRPATTSSRCPRTPSASRPSAAAAAPGSAPTRTWRCACAAASRGPTPCSTCTTSTASTRLACICAIDKATLPALVEYWVAARCEVAGVHEFVGNALVMKGEKKRTTDLRRRAAAGRRRTRRGGGRSRCMTRARSLIGIVIFLGPDRSSRSGTTVATRQGGLPARAGQAARRRDAVRPGRRVHAGLAHGPAQRLARRVRARGQDQTHDAPTARWYSRA